MTQNIDLLEPLPPVHDDSEIHRRLMAEAINVLLQREIDRASSGETIAPTAAGSRVEMLTASNQSLTGSGSDDKIIFGTVGFDDLGAWDNTQPTRITIPDGIGLVKVTYAYSVSTSTGCRVNIWFNGVDGALTGTPATNVTANTMTATGSWSEVVPGDYLELNFRLSATGVNLLLGSWIAVDLRRE